MALYRAAPPGPAVASAAFAGAALLVPPLVFGFAVYIDSFDDFQIRPFPCHALVARALLAVKRAKFLFGFRKRKKIYRRFRLFSFAVYSVQPVHIAAPLRNLPRENVFALVPEESKSFMED